MLYSILQAGCKKGQDYRSSSVGDVSKTQHEGEKRHPQPLFQVCPLKGYKLFLSCVTKHFFNAMFFNLFIYIYIYIQPRTYTIQEDERFNIFGDICLFKTSGRGVLHIIKIPQHPLDRFCTKPQRSCWRVVGVKQNNTSRVR